MHLDTAAHVKFCQTTVQFSMSELSSQPHCLHSKQTNNPTFLSKSVFLNAQDAHSKCCAVTASYPGHVSFTSSADWHRQADRQTGRQTDRQTLVSAEVSCLRLLLEAEFCLGLGRKKYVRRLHTIFNIVEGGALVRQFG